VVDGADLCTILVVEDDLTIAEIMRILLEDDGCHTITAATGSEALQQFAAEQPDLIILDLNLPDVDGLELLSQLGDVPVIVVSARARVPRAEGNVVAVLDKPFDATLLGETVQGVVATLRSRARH
jgi:CheY-like chemotaxis protein